MHILVLVGTVVPASTQLDTVAISTVISLFIPMLVSLLTKKTAASIVKVIVNIAAVAVTAVVALGINPGLGSITLVLVVNTFVLSLVASMAAYKGLWQPTGVTDAIATKTASIGIGTSLPEPADVAPPADSELGQIEAVAAPSGNVPADEYTVDPNYDPANDLVDPETQGEADTVGTPGAVGDPSIATDGTTSTEVKSV